MEIRRTLDCGIKVIAEKVEYLHSCAVGIFVKTGSVCENDENSGISHFIEHMLFKGTEKRTAKQISVDADAIGAQLNAFTSREYTCYHIKTVDETLDTALDILTDLFLHSVFDENEFEKERGVVLEEIAMCNDTPDDVVTEKCTEAVFRGSGLSSPILGTVDTITSFKASDLKKYYACHYTADNIVISVVGNFDEEILIGILNRCFDKCSLAEKTAFPTCDVHVRNSACEIFTEKDIEQTHICIGYPGLVYSDSKKYNQILMNTVFGGTMSSLLFQKIREENGLAYSVYSFATNFMENGCHYIYVGTSPAYKSKVLSLLDEITSDFVENGMTEEQFRQSRQYYRSSISLSEEVTESRMITIGKRYLFLGKYLSTDDELAVVSGLDFAETNEIIHRIFVPECRVLSMVGKKK